ncbi:hypothetical protein TSUD_168420 [Trifolium subterraneum]|nr:hypothetical protein TSUD_168420 [Trifolium subterraneum]
MYDLLSKFNQQELDPVRSKVWKLAVTERVRFEETSLHALRDCPLIVPFWLRVVPMEERSIFFMEEHQQWIRTNLNKCRNQRIGSAWSGDCSAFVAELWGVFEGLSYVRRLGFMAVELNIDLVMVVHVITKGILQSPVGAMLVRHIQRLIDLDCEVNIVHAYRESNQCADALASIGCTLDKEIIYYNDCPLEIKELLLADVMGITTPRMIPV